MRGLPPHGRAGTRRAPNLASSSLTRLESPRPCSRSPAEGGRLYMMGLSCTTRLCPLGGPSLVSQMAHTGEETAPVARVDGVEAAP